jgi:hypothetical protein
MLTTHVMCGVLVVTRRGLLRETTATLLVRNAWRGNLTIVLESQFNAIGEEVIPLTIEHVHAPKAHYTQYAEGSCGVHAIMLAMYLLDTASDAVSRGDMSEIRRVMQTRAPPLYALVARRIMVYYTRHDNADDFPDAVTRERLDVLLADEAGHAAVLTPRTRAGETRHTGRLREGLTVLNQYPVIVRLPGVHGALVSFRFASQDPERPRSYVRVDAYIDVNADIVLVRGGQIGLPMTERCFAFARYCVARLYPGPLVSGPVPRVADMITTKRDRPT